VTTGGAGPRVRGTRATRHGPEGRGRVAEAVVAVLVAAGAITYAAGQGSTTSQVRAPGAAGENGRVSEFAALAVTGAAVPFVAVVGARPAGAIVLPPSLSFTAPGQGDVTAADVAAFPGDSMRVAVSNAMGAWASHYGVLDLSGLGRIVEGAGGIEVDLAEPEVAGPNVLGPGLVRLDGPEVITFLSTAERNAAVERFILVLGGVLETGPRPTGQDLLATDDVAGLGSLLRAARGADVTIPPVRQVAGTVTVPDQPAFDEYLSERFGLSPPIRAIVQNGSGEPAIGEAVARKLIPVGFRIVLSGNAESFGHERTDVLAEGAEHIEAARRARRALGVGRVTLSAVPSGITDITIVVGEDFNG
jgi:hypothetical protein